jgi:pSer/pThr/pTyr-binding forkhead associated (FHA) protein
MSVDTFERRVEVAIDVGSLNGTWLSNRRVARALVVPGDELWLGSCPVRLD